MFYIRSKTGLNYGEFYRSYGLEDDYGLLHTINRLSSNTLYLLISAVCTLATEPFNLSLNFVTNKIFKICQVAEEGLANRKLSD